MKRWKRLLLRGLGVILGLLAAAILAFVIYVELRWDRHFDEVAGPDLQISTDPAVIAHGKYLVRGPAHCSECHSGSEEERKKNDAGVEVPLVGGIDFHIGPLGVMHSKNLTPDTETGIGRYPDRLVFRMMRNSIRPGGYTTLAPLMPFHRMADEDLVAVVSYLRSQPPVRHDIPDASWTFMGKVVRSLAPVFKPVFLDAPKTAPPSAPTVERGEYLARYVANCVGCHTKADLGSGRYVGPEFGGGFEFGPDPKSATSDGVTWYRSPNITKDPTGVLKNFPTKEEWLKRFHAGRVLPGTPMPWGNFSRMTDDDLLAVYTYLQSLPPVAYETGATAYRKE